MSYLIKLQHRCIEFRCNKGQTLLQAAIDANVLLPHGCKAGQCGRCKHRIIAGAYRYASGPYDAIDDTETSAGLVLCCQARPVSDMTIEPVVINSLQE